MLLAPGLGGGRFIAVSAAAQAPSAVTYDQVQPILQSKCANCHNAKGGAPFNLATFEDAKQWGGQILDVTQSRYMPPWLPAPGRGDFAGARRLSDAELAAIRAWIGAGMPAGNTPATAASEEPDWALGKPDAVVTLTQPVELAGNGADVFKNLVVPVSNETTPHHLRAIQIRPSDPQAVRSVWLSIDESGSRHAGDDQPGVASMEPLPDTHSASQGLIFWSPGTQAIQPMPGESWKIGPGSNLLLTTHLKTTGRKLALQIHIGLYYDKAGSSEGRVTVVMLQHHGPLSLPAGASATVINDSYVLPQAASVTAIYPRAHFLARSFDAYATTPQGKQVWLVSIPKWDVDWLEVYAYRHPVALPKGSVVHWTVTYDNSAENPHNPSDPPVDVHAGPGPKDEMDALYLEMMPPAGTSVAGWRKAMQPTANTVMGKP